MVPRDLVSVLRSEFNEFVISFKSEPYVDKPNIEKIIIHIERVVENILILADFLELSENEKAIAEITAQFHDIGRLQVLSAENTATDFTDHAEASTEYLKTNPLFEKLDEQTQNIIIQVIKNHNKPDLPKKEGEVILFYIKLLRDADKLDAWRSTSEYVNHKSGKPNMAIDLALSEKPYVNPALCKIIIDGGIPDKDDIVTFNDLIVFQMSWIFDLHFKKSFQILNQKQYIRHLYDSLPKNDNVIEIYRMIRIYIENRI